MTLETFADCRGLSVSGKTQGKNLRSRLRKAQARTELPADTFGLECGAVEHIPTTTERGWSESICLKFAVYSPILRAAVRGECE